MTATPQSQTSGNRHSPNRATRGLAIVGAVAATLVTWVIADPLCGVTLDVQLGSDADIQHVNAGTVVGATLVAGLVAWALLALFERVAPARARRLWTIVVLIVLVVSLLGPLQGGVTGSATTSLAIMHLVAAAVLVPVLAKTAARR